MILVIVYLFVSVFVNAETQVELEESVKALVTQNDSLLDLLEKSNIKVPQFVAPKLFSFIVAVNDAKQNDGKIANDETKVDSTAKRDTYQISPNKSENQSKPSEEVIDKLPVKNQTCDKTIEHPVNDKSNGQNASQIQQLNTLSELKEVQSFGSVDLIPVTNSSKSELKVHEKPVKNFVEITPVLSNQNETIPSKPDKSIEIAQPTVATCVQGMICSDSLVIVLIVSMNCNEIM